MSNRFRSRALTATAVAFVLVATSAISASAAPSENENVASFINRVAPDQGTVVRGQSTGTATRMATGNTTVSIPWNPASPIRIAGPSGGGLEVTLPGNLGLQPGQTTSDGTIVYQSAGDNVDAAVQTMHDGSVRMQTIINNPRAAHEFTYGIGAGFQPVKASDGSIWVAGFSKSGEYQAFGVRSAWARDANGKAVPTRYEIRGQDLVQIVTPDASTVYPIVADPSWIWYNFAWGAGFSKAETRNLASSGAITGFCAALPGAFRVACAIFGADWFFQASLAASARGCVFIAVVPAPIAMRWISSSCR